MITKQRGFIRGVGDAIAAMIVFIGVIGLIVGFALGLIFGGVVW